MFERKSIGSLDDCFKRQSERSERGVYFIRICGYSRRIGEFIEKYYTVARADGVVIEGKIPNPDGRNLAYYSEIMGDAFEVSEGFICNALKKWLPRMNGTQVQAVGSSLFYALESMRKSGKNDNMLKNAYIKFMCWLYYKFERIIAKLGSDSLPKILYEGDISNYELMIISILSGAGCDVVLLEYKGDEGYLKCDPRSQLSERFHEDGEGEFPTGFSLKRVREDCEKRSALSAVTGGEASVRACTNAWISGKWQEDILTPAAARGDDKGLFYNCYILVNGAEDKLLYQSELYDFGQKLKNSGRRNAVINSPVPPPTVDEISAVKRKNYSDITQAAADLSVNIRSMGLSGEMCKIAVGAFCRVINEEAQQGENLNRVVNKAVYLICWLNRYKKLLQGWKYPEVGCLIYYGACKSRSDALFLRMLSLMPVDVISFCPDLNSGGVMYGENLYRINYGSSAVLREFPQSGGDSAMGTAAYHAERELDSVMYTDSGIFRNRQYGKANSVRLRTMCEEIPILWDQEVKYRPNFSAAADSVNVPVIFAKISGVKDGDVGSYWAGVKQLFTEDTFIIRKAPFIKVGEPNPIRSFAAEFIKNGRLQRDKIKSHKCYRYGLLREEMQEHILDKLQLMMDLKPIRGMFENGTEYTVIATALNLDKEIVRMLQKFDFTKKNPKIVYINTTEEIISPEDSAVTEFLSLLGFDVVFFVPTGYRCVENHFNGEVMEEHQYGEYVYDLTVPDFGTVKKGSWKDRFFKRG